MNLNRVQLIGNVTNVPELKQTKSGHSVLTLGVATNERYTTQEGEVKETATFHDCVMWGKVAETLVGMLRKGSKVFVEGKLVTNEYEKDGVKRKTWRVQVSQLILLDRKTTAPQQSEPDFDPNFF